MSENPGDPRSDAHERVNPPASSDPEITPDAAKASTPPAAGAAPPMQPSIVVGGTVTSTWPTVIGVVAIVLGSWSILVGLWGLVAPIVLRHVFGHKVNQQLTWSSFEGPWRAALFTFAVLSIACALLLLVGGITLLRRKLRAVRLLQIWAIAMIVLTLVSVALQFALRDVYVNKMVADAQGAPVGRPVLVGGLVVGLLCGFLFSLSGPVFALIWFGRPVIRREVATWK